MSYGKEIFRPKYKETMDSLNTIKDNYYALDQEYQWSSKEKDKEIERLNNIINELEEEISRHIALCTDITLNDILDKLQELKGEDKE